ncbi:hypothetical protein [Yersinia pseudotuberculosis]|uniref:hypothetical protein n=1 Tax=Yersinia pseudotuberculosis TaxID=633 RepID=UPI0005DA7160|nr:hypothetical protein [Yersinia pseudotuberculosis]CND43654.1 Uncharacterised protein [Yersinia pseudotuberculosis]
MKTIKHILIIFVTLGVIGFVFVYFIAAGVNEKSVYTQDDFIKYHMLTDRDIEKIPKITRDYYFEYQPRDDYNPSSTIIFNHTLDASPLKNYLSSLGYERQKPNFGDSEVWLLPSETTQSTFYLWVDKAHNQIRLTKE